MITVKWELHKPWDFYVRVNGASSDDIKELEELDLHIGGYGGCVDLIIGGKDLKTRVKEWVYNNKKDTRVVYDDKWNDKIEIWDNTR